MVDAFALMARFAEAINTIASFAPDDSYRALCAKMVQDERERTLKAAVEAAVDSCRVLVEHSEGGDELRRVLPVLEEMQKALQTDGIDGHVRRIAQRIVDVFRKVAG